MSAINITYIIQRIAVPGLALKHVFEANIYNMISTDLSVVNFN